MNTKALVRDLGCVLGNQVRKIADRRPSVLVLHDIDGWALDHVFELWFDGFQPMRIVRRNWDYFASSRAFHSFDAVVFGYLDIYLRFRFNPAKSIVVIHDPCELFAQTPDWKKTVPDQERLRLLKSVKAVIVISEEMEGVLKSWGLKVWRIPTMSRLPAVDLVTVKSAAPSAISVFRDYPRKNAGLLRQLQKRGEETKHWRLQIHENPNFADQEYLEMTDSASIYVCSSWQEGGPLPAMDVMSRGGVVVTTPVGQIQEIITDGESGFICTAEEEFEDVLCKLFADPELLLGVRTKSLAAYRLSRDKELVRKRVSQTFCEIVETTCCED